MKIFVWLLTFFFAGSLFAAGSSYRNDIPGANSRRAGNPGANATLEGGMDADLYAPYGRFEDRAVSPNFDGTAPHGCEGILGGYDGSYEDVGDGMDKYGNF